MRKIKLILSIILIIVVFIIVGYDERYDTISCEVVSYDSESVCLHHPNGEFYTYWGTIGDNDNASEVVAVFDNKGTENPFDDEVIKIK